MRNPTPGPGGGGMYVSELQRTRLLDATFAVVAEVGYRGMAVRAVTERAGMSAKTFYDLFTDREDCFLAAFDHGIDRLQARVRPAWEGEREWTASIRAGLGALLEALDCEPALRRLVFVEALAAGPRVLARRAEVLQQLAGLIDEGRAGAKDGGELPGLLAEGLVGATFGVIHARLLQPGLGPLSGLLNELVGTIVLPYRGRGVATRELSRPTKPSGSRGASRSEIEDPAHPAWRASHASDRLSPNGGGRRDAPPIGSLKPVDFRLTVRTQTVLAALAELNGRGSSPSNQELSQLAGISDQGQISRLMMRLAEQGLVENTGGRGQGAPKAWLLTAAGRDLLQANPPLRPQHTPTPRAPQRKRSPRPGARKQQRADRGSRPAVRVTARIQLVLTAIATLSDRGRNPSNREISSAAGVHDQGQISKLLARLESHGLLQNTGGATAGIPNAWHLTLRGEETLSASRPANSGAGQ